MVVLPDVFYTTAEQEVELDTLYWAAIAEKQKKMDKEYKLTKRIPKYTAKAHISPPKRIFYVCAKGVFWKDATGPEMPKEAQPGGKRYKIDVAADGKGEIPKYLETHSEFYVKFNASSAYGACVYYCAEEDVYPASLECAKQILYIENEDQYDICCG